MFRITLILMLTVFCFKAMPCIASGLELNTSWSFYKSVFINKDGRVIDYEKNGITTSEGQSYALLRAVMINDKQTFDKIYVWTKNNLKRPDDNLFVWLWGEKEGKYGIIDSNSATDADVDIAFALIIASKKWKNFYYYQEAKKIIADIWNYETVSIQNKRILTAGFNQTKNEIIDINPSYFAPYAFRLFALYDKNNWNSLIDDNYELLQDIIDSTESKLPPDWFVINKTTGAFSLYINSPKSNFSYDAVRTFARLYSDYIFTSDKRAEKIINNAGFFVKQQQSGDKFCTNIKANKELCDSNESLPKIGILFPVINYLDLTVGKNIYESKINSVYNKFGYWGNPFDYYAQNLVWFGIWIKLNENKYKKFNMGK